MTKNRFFNIVSILLPLVLALTACASSPNNAANGNQEEMSEPAEQEAESMPEPISLTDGLGREITLEGPAQRVVSLAPSNIEILFAIGAGDQVVGRDDFANWPEEVIDLPSTGGSFGELNTEIILDLEPDLVLAAELTTPEQVQSLEDLGLTVFFLTNPIDLEGLYKNIMTVAQLTGHEGEAEQVVEGLKGRVAAIEDKIATTDEKPLVFYELDSTDPSAPWTAGGGTFIDTLITLAGGENIGAAFEGAWVQISAEEIISQDPDIILLGDSIWGVTSEDVAARPGWEALSAIQNGMVFPFNDDLASRPGPRLIDGLEELAKLIHPELFE